MARFTTRAHAPMSLSGCSRLPGTVYPVFGPLGSPYARGDLRARQGDQGTVVVLASLFGVSGPLSVGLGLRPLGLPFSPCSDASLRRCSRSGGGRVIYCRQRGTAAAAVPALSLSGARPGRWLFGSDAAGRTTFSLALSSFNYSFPRYSLCHWRRHGPQTCTDHLVATGSFTIT